MAAINYPLTVEQGGTTMFRMKFIQNGKSLPVDNIKFVGSVKNSVWDTEGINFRFEQVAENAVDVFLDADLTESLDYQKGVYEIKMIASNNYNTPIFRGEVTVILGATDDTSY